MSGRQFSLTDERKRAAFGALDAKRPGNTEWAWHVFDVLNLRWRCPPCVQATEQAVREVRGAAVLRSDIARVEEWSSGV